MPRRVEELRDEGLRDVPSLALSVVVCQLCCDLPNRQTGRVHRAHLLTVNNDSLAPEHLSLALCPTEAGNHALGQACVLLLRDCGQDRNDGIAEHSGAVEVLLSETLPRHTVAVEPLQVF